MGCESIAVAGFDSPPLFHRPMHTKKEMDMTVYVCVNYTREGNTEVVGVCSTREGCLSMLSKHRGKDVRFSPPRYQGPDNGSIEECVMKNHPTLGTFWDCVGHAIKSEVQEG